MSDSDKFVTKAVGYTDTGTAVAKEHPLIVRPEVSYAARLDWQITVTPDGLGLIIEAPPGLEFDLTDSRFRVSGDKKRIEVRVK